MSRVNIPKLLYSSLFPIYRLEFWSLACPIAAPVIPLSTYEGTVTFIRFALLARGSVKLRDFTFLMQNIK